MTFVEWYTLGNALSHYITTIVLVGICIIFYFKKNSHKKRILWYIIPCSLISIFMILEGLTALGIKLPKETGIANGLLAIIIGTIFAVNSSKIKEKTGTKIGYSILIATFIIGILEVLKSYLQDSIYFIMSSSVTFTATILAYILIVRYLAKVK